MIDNKNSHLYGMIAQNRNNSLASGTTTDGVPEGSTNLYFTSTRARNVFTVQSPLSYVPSTGTLSVSGVTQNITVVTAVTPSVLFSTLHFTNGILTSVS